MRILQELARLQTKLEREEAITEILDLLEKVVAPSNLLMNRGDPNLDFAFCSDRV